MAYTFNDTENYQGLVQQYEKECGFDYGDISGSTAKLKQFAVQVNEALDDFFAIGIQASGKWQLDDSNHADYPIIYTNLVSGQQDYSFTEDETGNLILDIEKAMILPSAAATQYVELCRKADQQSEPSGIDTEDGSTGVPASYDKTANGIFLDPTPDYNATNGLKLYVNRTASYFTYADTTKKPGIPALFHKYLYLKPALAYARRKSLGNLTELEREVLLLEGNEEAGIIGAIARYFGKRAKDERAIITPKLTRYI